ncbi:hypothetical protein JX265_000782 [Neoarthrinium moseri]|uniref:VCBS repeat-containing protein n=1 Tax=Neoarthrinium moseri TaxID=1658444 RepID=A0A9Q0ATZ5_9PEZI|nr:hypothetical protein JX265_000782 [Neoarthrinium moseri]
MLPQLLSYSALVAAAFAAVGQGASVPLERRQGQNTPATNASIPVKSLGQLSLSNVGFAEVISQGGKDALFVSSFALLGDSVHRINDISTVGSVGINKLKATTVPGSITWPNDITIAPKAVFGTEGVLVGGGFLVPTKTNGGIYFSANSGSTSGSWVQLISQSGWWYHRVIFADMDGDGVPDMVSCRANKPLIGATKTMLVILKPQNQNKPLGTWVETEIGAGCDALFTVADLDGDGIPEVIAPSYFTEKLNIYHSSASNGFANPKNVKTVTIDSTIGAAFDAQYVDINGDGKKDLLVSNHQGDGTGGVYAYEIPANVTNARGYTRHTLASGFPVTQRGLNQAAPGSPRAFFPTPATSKAGIPYIALAGDAAQKAYVLIPGLTAWTYKTTYLHDCGCTVGQVSVVDVDGDGYSEVIIPCYDDGKLAAYTFKS